MSTFLEIIQWALPAGGLGSVFVWLFNRTLRNLRETKEVHDTYKKMYDSLKLTIDDLQDEITQLYKELARFRKAVSKATTCALYDDCPVRNELQQHEDNVIKPKRRRSQRQCVDNETDFVSIDTDVGGTVEDIG